MHQKSQTYHVLREVFYFTLIWIVARTHTREIISLVYLIWILLFSLNYDSRDLCESIECSFVIQKKKNSNSNNNGKYVIHFHIVGIFIQFQFSCKWTFSTTFWRLCMWPKKDCKISNYKGEYTNFDLLIESIYTQHTNVHVLSSSL